MDNFEEKVNVEESEEIIEDVVSEEEESVDEVALLKHELELLKEEIRLRDERETANSRILKEITEFEEYFPEVNLHQIPSEIWEQVRQGASLSASFALSLRKLEIEKQKTSDFNEKNRRMSAGSLIQGEGEKYYSPSEVKKMTPAQVKLHYDDILESMRHWN
jgi:hypothetical protein